MREKQGNGGIVLDRAGRMNRFVCGTCNADYPLQEPRWRCDCGGLLDIDFSFSLNPAVLKDRKPNLWRYREAIPIDEDRNIVSFDEGFTPLLPIELEGRVFYAKLDYLFPSGSFKDRGATVLVSKVKELGIRKVVEDSSGNTGCAISAYCARAGIECDIFVPDKTSVEKLNQIQYYGARLHKIPGPREATAQAAMQAAETAYYASHVWNPFFHQGTKTVAYELWEQLGFRIPDALLLPTGNGSLLIGAYLGFQDLLKQGFISRIPRLIAVQSERCAPLYRMFKENRLELPNIESETTVAEGIAIAAPARAKQIVDRVRETGGDFLTVSEREVHEARRDLGRIGLFVEPTSASAVAGYRNYKPNRSEVAVVLLTGHGLKSHVSLQ